MKKLVLAAACFAFAATAQNSKPNFSGTWELDTAKSDFGPLPAPEKQTRVIEHQSEVGARHLAWRSGDQTAEALRSLTQRVIVQHQVAGDRWIVSRTVAGDATAIQDRLDVAVVLDVLDAGRVV